MNAVESIGAAHGVEEIMLISIYRFRDIIIIPTTAITLPGIYQIVEPVCIASANDIELVANHIQSTLERGTPLVELPERGKAPPPVVLKYAKVKSWRAFQRVAESWSLEMEGGRWHLVPKRRAVDGGFEEDRSGVIEFSQSEPREKILREIATRVCQATLQD